MPDWIACAGGDGRYPLPKQLHACDLATVGSGLATLGSNPAKVDSELTHHGSDSARLVRLTACVGQFRWRMRAAVLAKVGNRRAVRTSGLCLRKGPGLRRCAPPSGLLSQRRTRFWPCSFPPLQPAPLLMFDWREKENIRSSKFTAPDQRNKDDHSDGRVICVSTPAPSCASHLTSLRCARASTSMH